MFIDLGNRVSLTDEQFRDEMAQRVSENPGKDVFLGCPLCGVARKTISRSTENQQ
jgi:hypothetical protein